MINYIETIVMEEVDKTTDTSLKQKPIGLGGRGWWESEYNDANVDCVCEVE